MPKQKFREIVFQLLYSADFAPDEGESVAPLIMEQLSVTKASLCKALEKQCLICARQGEIDERIASASTEYTFERIPRIEKSILRLGAFELLYGQDVPPKVAIAEAMRLCHKFAAPEGAKYVNAILDALYKQSHAAESSAKQ